MDRWLHLVGIALLVEAAVAFLPNVRDPGSNKFALVAHSACVAVAGGAALITARRRSSPDVIRAFLWICFLAIGGMTIAGSLGLVNSDYALRNSSYIFGTASWSMVVFGAPVLWGAALARRDVPSDLPARKAGRIAAGVVQLGFVFLFVSELRTWGMMGYLGGSSYVSTAAASYGISQATHLADRILLLWATVESVRTPVDEETVVRRAVRIHKLMSWWILISLLSSVLGQLAQQMQMSGNFQAAPAYFLRVLMFKTLALAAMMAVTLHFTVRKRSVESVVSGNPRSGAEA